MGGKARAPAASKSHLPRAEGIRHLLPAAPAGFGLPRGSSELARRQGSLGPALGQPRSGRRWIPRFRAERRRPPGPTARAGSPALGSESARRRSPALGRGEESCSPLCPPRPRRGEQARSLATAGLCARLSGHTLSAQRAPRAGWPRTSADSSGVRRACTGVRSTPGGSRSLGSLDSFSPSPGSQRGELEADPAGRRAPINSERVPAWRPPGCARTDKVVRRDSGSAAAAGEDPAAAEPPCALELIPRTGALRARDLAGCCLPADVQEAPRCGEFLTRRKWESLESWP